MKKFRRKKKKRSSKKKKKRGQKQIEFKRDPVFSSLGGSSLVMVVYVLGIDIGVISFILGVKEELQA